MKRVLSLSLVFLIIFNIMAPSMAATNMYEVNESLDSTVLDVESYKEVASTADSTEDLELLYHPGYTLLKSGNLKSFPDEEHRIISEKIDVDSNSIYYFKNLSAKYGNCFYVIYNSNNEVISYLGTGESSTGEVIESIKVTMPENASYFRLACDLKVNDKMFEATKVYTETNEEIAEPAIISFIDDDCRSDVYRCDDDVDADDDLYSLIEELDLPYTLACPPDNLDTEGYLTTEQLKELYANGVDIISHHLKEYAMTEFESIEEYEEDTKACLEKFKNMGIEVSGVAYPNGRINDDYMSVVEKYFKLGFTTDRAINTLPYESSYIHRCEVFPESGIYNIDDAKALVDSVAENGGWLVFMTHCWFDTFSADELRELVQYIRSKNIEILNVTDVIENYANPIDKGIAKKPLTDMAEDFFIVDCMGRAYTNNIAAYTNTIETNNIDTNNITIIEKSSIKWNEIPIDYNIAITLLVSGKVKDRYFELEELSKEEQILQKKRNVSEKIDVTPNSTYKIENLSAKYGNCFYVIYNSNDEVISYIGTDESSTGEKIEELIITMPSDASYFRMACDLDVKDKMFKVYCASEKQEPSVSYRSHVQNIGWESSWTYNGETSGTVGKCLRLEGLQVCLHNKPYEGTVTYRSHVQNTGWESTWRTDSQVSGSVGKSLRVEAIQIKLTDEMAEHYDIYYRLQIQDYGWLGWAKNGQSAGSEGHSKKVEAIEIKLVEKGEAAPGSTDRRFIRASGLKYRSHVQNIGWMSYVDEKGLSGTTGKGLRVEAFQLLLTTNQYDGGIKYRGYIQNNGWESWKYDKEESGTTGKGLRMEAFQIELYGDVANYYDVYYRVHVQNIGWMGWAKNGESAGTRRIWI